MQKIIICSTLILCIIAYICRFVSKTSHNTHSNVFQGASGYYQNNAKVPSTVLRTQFEKLYNQALTKQEVAELISKLELRTIPQRKVYCNHWPKLADVAKHKKRCPGLYVVDNSAWCKK